MFVLVTTAESVYLFSGEDGELLREYGAGAISVSPSGYCALYLADTVVLLSPTGEEVCRLEADCTLNLSQGEHCFVRQSGVWGSEYEWICSLETGETLSGPYQQLEFLTAVGDEDYYLCSSFETSCLTDSSARLILSEVDGTRRWGLVTAQGNELLPLEYERIVPLSDTLLAALKDGQWERIPLPAAQAEPAD